MNKRINTHVSYFVTSNIRFLPFIILIFLHATEHESPTGSPLFKSFNSTPACIRQSSQLCRAEQLFLTNRLIHVKNSIETFLGISVDDNSSLPRIAFCFSGGGFRAKIASLGILHAAEQTGLLACTSYCSCLSGSTWTMAPWITSKKTVAQFYHETMMRPHTGFLQLNSPQKFLSFIIDMLQRIFIDKNPNIIDVYADHLTHHLLDGITDNPTQITLSESHQHVLEGKVPLPFYTAIIANKEPYEWLEFSPFEVGSALLNAFIPTWSFGRRFQEGKTVNVHSQEELGYLLGIFGAAFGLNIREFARFCIENMYTSSITLTAPLGILLKRVVKRMCKSFVGSTRPFHALIPNFTHQLKDASYSTHPDLKLIDAGIAFNLPLPPLLHPARNIDVIIIFDTSAKVIGAPELHKAYAYMQARKISFTQISSTAGYEPITLLKNERNSPTIIYIPLLKNDKYALDFDPQHCILEGPCNTFNFSYTKEEMTILAEFAGCMLTHHLDSIKQEIQSVILAKQQHAHSDNS